jgi:hypothetical protein
MVVHWIVLCSFFTHRAVPGAIAYAPSGLVYPFNFHFFAALGDCFGNIIHPNTNTFQNNPLAADLKHPAALIR